uniref:Uncharacterized protein n=1 Tax=Steinernema glaseri TaxID=37863 RepID=A0A1I7Y360_9BILA
MDIRRRRRNKVVTNDPKDTKNRSTNDRGKWRYQNKITKKKTRTLIPLGSRSRSKGSRSKWAKLGGHGACPEDIKTFCLPSEEDVEKVSLRFAWILHFERRDGAGPNTITLATLARLGTSSSLLGLGHGDLPAVF